MNDHCTTGGLLHEWEYFGNYKSPFDRRTCFVYVCARCGKRRTKISNNRRDLDSTEREVTA